MSAFPCIKVKYTSYGEFPFHEGSLLLELSINVVSKEQAIAICDSWEKKSDAVYGKLMEMLLLTNSDS